MTEDPDSASMAALVEEIAAATADLRTLADEADVPAVERNAARIEAVVGVLRMNVPPELHED